jgi:hypothetical protein
MRTTLALLLLLTTVLLPGCAPEDDLFEETTFDPDDAKADGSYGKVLVFTPGSHWKVRMQCGEHLFCDVIAGATLPGGADTLAPFIKAYFTDHPTASEWVIEGLFEITLASEAEDERGEARGRGHSRHIVTRLADGRATVERQYVQTQGPNGTLVYMDDLFEGELVASEFRPRTTVVATLRLHREKLLYPVAHEVPVFFVARWW